MVKVPKRGNIELSGELVLWSQEGGYADSSIEVGGASLSDILDPERREKCDLGPVRITIEFLELLEVALPAPGPVDRVTPGRERLDEP